MIDVTGTFSPTVFQVVAVLEGVCDRARDDLESLGIPTLPVQVVAGENEAIKRAVQMSISKPSFELEPKLVPTLRTGCRLYLGKLTKVRRDQLKLGIEEPSDTDEQIDRVRALIRATAPQGTFDAALDTALGVHEDDDTPTSKAKLGVHRGGRSRRPAGATE